MYLSLPTFLSHTETVLMASVCVASVRIVRLSPSVPCTYCIPAAQDHNCATVGQCRVEPGSSQRVG